MASLTRGLRGPFLSARLAPWRTIAIRVGVIGAAFFCGYVAAGGRNDDGGSGGGGGGVSGGGGGGGDGRSVGAGAAATAAAGPRGRTLGASEAPTFPTMAKGGGGHGGGWEGEKGAGSAPRPPVASSYMALPSTTAALFINIGPHLSSLVPPRGLANTSVLSVEAHPAVAAELLATTVPRYPGRFFVLPAAVVGPSSPGGVPEGGVRSFHTYGVRGRSSSLAKHGNPEFAFARDGAGATEGAVGFVAELTLRQLLNAISPRIVLPLLKIDAQGMDFDIMVGGGDAVKRVHRIQAEVDTGRSDYVGVRNNLKADWVPLMTRLGFELERVVAPEKRETQVIFRRKDLPPAPKST
ncbi:hypothetical protein MMPV_004591 [Pyropia vietnamensis]